MIPTIPERGSRKRQVLDEQPIAEALAQPIDLDHLVAEPRPGRDGDLELAFRTLRIVRLGEQLFVGRQPGLALRLARLGRRPDPFELSGERALARIGRLLLAR